MRLCSLGYMYGWLLLLRTKETFSPVAHLYNLRLCNFASSWKDLYTAFNVSKWCLLFQNEKLLNSTQAKSLRRVLKMTAYIDWSGFVVFIYVKDSLKDAARSTKWNSIQHHQMWTFHPSQSHWWANKMRISFDLYWFRLEQRRNCIVLSVSLLDS